MPVAVPLAIVGASVAGSAIAGSAAKSAAQTQANAANQATNVQQQMFDTTQKNLAPFITQGSAAGSALSKLLGTAANSNITAGSPNWDAYLSANPDVSARANELVNSGVIGANGQWATPEDWAAFQYQNTGQSEGRQLPTYTSADASANSNSIEDALQNLPGYQFTRDQGIASINRALGSMGQTGAQAKGIARFVTGLADNTYNSQVANLQAATNTGESAAAGQGSIGAQTGSNLANTITGAGAAQAAGTVGAANAANSALSSIPNALLVNKLFSGGNAGIYGNSAGSSTPSYGDYYL